MPKIRTIRTKKKPEGWESIEGPLMEFQTKMRDCENAPCEGKRKPEMIWPIFRLHH